MRTATASKERTGKPFGSGALDRAADITETVDHRVDVSLAVHRRSAFRCPTRLTLADLLRRRQREPGMIRRWRCG